MVVLVNKRILGNSKLWLISFLVLAVKFHLIAQNYSHQNLTRITQVDNAQSLVCTSPPDVSEMLAMSESNEPSCRQILMHHTERSYSNVRNHHTVEVLSCSNLEYFKATSTSQNDDEYDDWVDEIGSGGVPQYIQNFESFSSGVDIEGDDIGPNGLTLTNLEGGDIETSSSPGGSPAIGSRGAEISANSVDDGDDVRIEFDCEVNYVGFYFIDLTNSSLSSEVLVRFDDGSTCTIPIDHQPQNCQCEEFLGIVAKNGRSITRIDILPLGGSSYGLDNIMFGCTIPPCDLTDAGKTTERCNDNDTGTDPADDYITFRLNPTGSNLGSTYSVSVNNGGTITLASGGNVNNVPYGSSRGFRLQEGSADGTTYRITVTDNTDNSCEVTTTVSENSCSDDCDLTDIGLTTERCNDNDTGSDPGDDYITFRLNPMGVNLGSTYSVSVNNGGTVVLASGGDVNNVPYGSSRGFRLQAGSADGTTYRITVTDNANSCQIRTTVSQSPCSSDCVLTNIRASSELCNDNGTGADPSDDYIRVSLNPTGTNLGSTFSVTANNGGTVTLNNGSPAVNLSYGTGRIFRLQAGSADGSTTYTITVTDDSNSGCEITTTVSQSPCSDDCGLTDARKSNERCDSNGTDSDPTDDFIRFRLNPTGSNLGSTFSVTVNNGGTVTLFDGNPAVNLSYGTGRLFRLQDGSADGSTTYTVTVTDDADNSCTITAMVQQNSCSPDCELTDADKSNERCNDNGTGSDPTDDFIRFRLDPIGNNLGSTFSVTSSNGGMVTLLDDGSPAVNLSYGTSRLFRLQAGSADGTTTYTITVTDDSNSGCEITATVSQSPCSDDCILTDAGEQNEQCNDNGTGSDPTDDYILFSLNPVGSNLGSTYSVTSNNGGTVTLDSGNPATNLAYGTLRNFRLQAGSADGTTTYTITVTDDSNSVCEITAMVSQSPCSDDCILTDAGEQNEQCNGNGTSSDPTDDYILFSLNPVGSNLSSTYSVTVNNGGTVTLDSGNPATNLAYGTPRNFRLQAGSADGTTTYTITVTDDSNSSCQVTTMVSQSPCSSNCVLADAGESNEECNSNGTDSDPSDDYITFMLNPTGSNLGSAYSVSVNNGGTVTLANGDPADNVPYGSSRGFRLQAGSANGTTTYTITITDSANSSCRLTTTVFQNSCSSDCILTDAGASNEQCNANGTTSDSTDDYIIFSLNPVGSNLGSTYSVTANNGGMVTLANGTPATAVSYGSSTGFRLQAGSADGTTTYTITVTDSANSSCQITNTIFQNSCSSDCILTDAGVSNEQCNANGTTSDSTDDYIIFSLNPVGNNLSSTYAVTANNGGTVTLANGTPATAVSYGSSTTFRLQAGSADGTTYMVTITDSADASCQITITVRQDACSDACLLMITASNILSCQDNGTLLDGSDDYFTLEVNATASGGGTQYEVVMNANPDGTGGTVLGTANYGSSIIIGDGINGAVGTFAADNISTYTITVRSSIDATCFDQFTTTPVSNCLSCPVISNPTPPQEVCEGQIVSQISVNIDVAANIEFVYFNTPQTASNIYTGGTTLGTVAANSGSASITSISDFTTAGIYYIYARLNPMPAGANCRPSVETTVVVNPIPNLNLMVEGPAVCEGQTAIITINNAESDIIYQLRSDADDSAIGAPITGNGGDVTFQIYNLTANTYVYNILATNTNTGCQGELTNLVSLIVNSCIFPPPNCPIPPCHIIPSNPVIYFGNGVTPNLPNTTNTSANANDGITFPNNIRRNITIRLPISFHNSSGNPAYIQGWIDWNGNNEIESNEQIADLTIPYDSSNFNQLISHPVMVPAYAVQSQSILVQFRISTDPIIINSPCGTGICAADGEIEDYLIQVECPPRACLPTQITITRG